MSSVKNHYSVLIFVYEFTVNFVYELGVATNWFGYNFTYSQLHELKGLNFNKSDS